MWKFGIFLIWCQFGWLQGVDIPQLEVLYYSSDPNLQWLPKKVAKLSDLEAHGAQLGKFQPRQKVDVAYKKGFPSAEDFYRNFVERQNPVIFSHAVDIIDYEYLKLENLNKSSRAALSYVQLSSFINQEKEQENLL